MAEIDMAHQATCAPAGCAIRPGRLGGGPAEHIGTATLRVVLAAALVPGQVELTTLDLPGGTDVGGALHASGLRQRLPESAWPALQIGIWGQACTPATLLRDGDRIELYRALLVDPKEARRLRYRRDGLRKPQRQAK